MTKNLTYNITREDAASVMWVSTRTLDRKISKWIFSYKKMWNRIYLAIEEVNAYKEQLQSVYEAIPQSVVVSENSALANLDKDLAKIWEIKELISNNFNKFFAVLKEKDAQLQEKNNIIFSMQTKVMQLEAQLSAVKSLPDYSKQAKQLQEENQKLQSQIKLSVPLTVHNQEKKYLIEEQNRIEKDFEEREDEFNKEKEHLLLYNEKKEIENEQLQIFLKKEKLKNIVFIVLIILIVLVLFFVFVNR